MNFTTVHLHRRANPPGRATPSHVGAWLQSVLRRLLTVPAPSAPAVRDRVREAAELREWATTVQRNDPRFAADLIAAADRHEREVR